MRTFYIAMMLAALIVPARAEELAAPGAAVGAAPAILFTSSSSNIARIAPPHTVLIITADGRTMRGDKELKDMPREELLIVINELIDLIKRR